MNFKNLSFLALLMTCLFTACNEDEGTTAPETPDHSGELVTIELSYDQFIGANSLKSTATNDSVAHNYISTGYTVIIKDAYDVATGTFVDLTYEDVDLAAPQIIFDAIGWFGIEVSHPNYVVSESGYEAYYSVNSPRIDVANSGNLSIDLELTQVSVHLANGTGAEEFDSQIQSAKINDVILTDFNIPVYVPAEVDYVVDVVFTHDGGSDTLTNSGLAGEAYYHIINDQSISEGIIFELPEFTPPTDGGGIGL